MGDLGKCANCSNYFSEFFLLHTKKAHAIFGFFMFSNFSIWSWLRPLWHWIFFLPLATKLVESVKVLIFKTNIKTLSFFLRVTFAGFAFENDNLNTKLSFDHTITAVKSQFSRNRTLFCSKWKYVVMVKKRAAIFVPHALAKNWFLLTRYEMLWSIRFSHYIFVRHFAPENIV